MHGLVDEKTVKKGENKRGLRMRDGEQLIDLTAVNFIRFSTFLTETILQFDSTMEILMV